MILDKYLPDYPRLHANLFINKEPQFLGAEGDSRYPGQFYEIDPGTPWYNLWEIQVGLSDWFSFYPPMKVSRKVRNSSALLVVGGDTLGLGWGYHALRLLAGPLNTAVRYKVPSVVWGASIGPFDNQPRIEKYVLPLLAKTDLILVREPATKDYLKTHGIENNVHQVADCAFLLPLEDSKLPTELENALNAGAVGINLSPLLKRAEYANCDANQWLVNSVQWIVGLRKRIKEPIILIPHVMAKPFVEAFNDDFSFLRQIHERLPAEMQKDVLLFDARHLNSKQIKKVVSRLKVFAGTRTHSTIAGLSSCVPTFTISFSIKGFGINRAVYGHENWTMPFSKITPELFAEQICRLLHEESSVRAYLESFIPEYSQTAYRAGELLAERLASTSSPN